MKTIKFFITVSIFAIVTQVLAQKPYLSITSDKELQLFGHTNNYYQIESSTNLSFDGWSRYGSFFRTSSVPHVHFIGTTNKQEFFRAMALVAITNISYADSCAEHDNVNVAFVGDVTNFTVIATHPTYEVTDYTSGADWRNCSPDDPSQDYPFTSFVWKPYDVDGHYVVFNRGSSFWRPQGMTVTVNGNYSTTDIHYIEIGMPTPNYDGYPIFFVLYSDGNIRLTPFPPLGQPSVKFGSSIIVGPAKEDLRPFVDIAFVNYVTSSRTLFVTYRTGGTATIKIDTITRERAVLKVVVNYPTDKPFCTIRSMWVEDGNSDCDSVLWKDINGLTNNTPVLSLSGTAGEEWFFTRQTKSIHNQSAPDFRIILN